MSEFQKFNNAQLEINLTEVYGHKNQFQVLHPLLNFYTLRDVNFAPSCLREMKNETETISIEENQCSKIHLEYLKNGQFKGSNQLKVLAEEKEKLYAEFLSSQKLANGFIEKFPLIFAKSGSSYAFHLVQSGYKPYNQKDWIEDHLAFFKISELKNILTQFQIHNLMFQTLANLSESELIELIKGARVLITDGKIFVKNQSFLGFSPLSFWVYDRIEFEKYIKEMPYDILFNDGSALCLEKLGDWCWSYSSKHTLTFLSRYSIFLVSVLWFSLALLIYLFWNRSADRKRNLELKKMSLQVLSHEFRTPVATQLLLLEQVKKDLRSLSARENAIADGLTRLEAESFRLQRIIEVSRVYLQAENGRIPFQYREINSINCWIKELLEEYQETHPEYSAIKYKLLNEDRPFYTDLFWLKYIIINLLDNAFCHGALPVTLTLNPIGDRIKICIQDTGKCDFTTLGEMTGSFAKSTKSKGMGLGLSIVNNIVSEWGQSLEYSRNPTIFSLHLDSKK